MHLLEVKDLRTSYSTYKGIVRAIDGASLSLKRGESLGVAGESGCGKTTLALSIMRLLPPNGKVNAGEIIYDGNDILKMDEAEFRKDVSWQHISYVFQGSMNALNPLQKVCDQIVEAIMLHEKTTKKEAIARCIELMELIDISPKRMNDYPFELSGGMKQRIMIAMSLACHPSIVILDEPVTGLDVIVSSHIMALIKELRTKMNLSTMLISHNLSVIAETCDSVTILYAGQIVEYSDAVSIFEYPVHPYARALIHSFPSLHGERTRVEELKGSVPNLIKPPTGCRFHPRCPYACDICRKEEPELREVSKNHFVRCYHED